MPAVGADRHTVDRSCVALGGEQFLTCHSVPDLDGPIRTPRNDSPAIGAEGNALDQVIVSIKAEQLLARLRIADLDCLPSCLGNASSIAADGDTEDRASGT